ncbi:MAG: hypothetical protein KJ882_05040, partial [Proteobacteria bacterium]|nr:hypothetical protein [Pseudomonadota bacterium]
MVSPGGATRSRAAAGLRGALFFIQEWCGVNSPRQKPLAHLQDIDDPGRDFLFRNPSKGLTFFS